MGKGEMLFCIILLPVPHVFFFSCFSWGAGSASENYYISTSVFSDGGTSMQSGIFKTVGTVGQSSPLMDPADPLYSASYDLYPGFWYTLEAVSGCGDLESFATAFGHVTGEPGYNFPCDSDTDGDMDGVDLAEYADTL